MPKEPVRSVLTDEHQAAFDRVTSYFTPHQACWGWIEYWMWDVLHALRPWPFWLEYSESIERDLGVLRDGAKTWFAWDFEKKEWVRVRASIWAEHTKRYSVLDAQEGRAPLPGGTEDKK